MRIFDGKMYRDATEDEIAAYEEGLAQQTPPEPTTEERITALEEQLAATKILLGVE
ncbi:MAG: hypothetical protein J6K98_02180 [Clostridia bacterium]|nr:hypothetical protein [Clostridia bacterium]